MQRLPQHTPGIQPLLLPRQGSPKQGKTGEPCLRSPDRPAELLDRDGDIAITNRQLPPPVLHLTGQVIRQIGRQICRQPLQLKRQLIKGLALIQTPKLLNPGGERDGSSTGPVKPNHRFDGLFNRASR